MTYGRGLDKRDLDNWITGHYGEDQFKDDIREKEIDVYCGECGTQYDEKKVKFLDISEGFQGEDIMKFQCPKGHVASSVRFG